MKEGKVSLNDVTIRYLERTDLLMQKVATSTDDSPCALASSTAIFFFNWLTVVVVLRRKEACWSCKAPYNVLHPVYEKVRSRSLTCSKFKHTLLFVSFFANAFSCTHRKLYPHLCYKCAQLNVEKRLAYADLTGRVAVVTGGRIRIGFHVTVSLLRMGATVVVTTRFPVDCILQLSKVHQLKKIE